MICFVCPPVDDSGVTVIGLGMSDDELARIEAGRPVALAGRECGGCIDNTDVMLCGGWSDQEATGRVRDAVATIQGITEPVEVTFSGPLPDADATSDSAVVTSKKDRIYGTRCQGIMTVPATHAGGMVMVVGLTDEASGLLRNRQSLFVRFRMLNQTSLDALAISGGDDLPKRLSLDRVNEVISETGLNGGSVCLIFVCQPSWYECRQAFHDVVGRGFPEMVDKYKSMHRNDWPEWLPSWPARLAGSAEATA